MFSPDKVVKHCVYVHWSNEAFDFLVFQISVILKCFKSLNNYFSARYLETIYTTNHKLSLSVLCVYGCSSFALSQSTNISEWHLNKRQTGFRTLEYCIIDLRIPNNSDMCSWVFHLIELQLCTGVSAWDIMQKLLLQSFEEIMCTVWCLCVTVQLH